MYEFTGTVGEVCPVQTFASGFTKRELVMIEDGANERLTRVPFNFKRENASMLEGINPGDRVTVGFLLDGREWLDARTNKVRHFCDLVGMRVSVLSRATVSGTDEPAPTGPAGVAPAAAGGDDSDIPF